MRLWAQTKQWLPAKRAHQHESLWDYSCECLQRTFSFSSAAWKQGRWPKSQQPPFHCPQTCFFLPRCSACSTSSVRVLLTEQRLEHSVDMRALMFHSEPIWAACLQWWSCPLGWRVSLISGSKAPTQLQCDSVWKRWTCFPGLQFLLCQNKSSTSHSLSWRKILPICGKGSIICKLSSLPCYSSLRQIIKESSQ